MRKRIRRPFELSTFLINPSRFPRYTRKLKKLLRQIDVPDVIESTSREHFIESVHKFYQGENHFLFVWGGDGTAHDAINAFMDASRTAKEETPKKSLGFLRGGSGNGTQDSYEVPFGLKEQLAAYSRSVHENYVVKVDLMLARQNGKAEYCQLAGIGLDAEVLKRRERRKAGAQGKKRTKSGFLNYMISFIETFYLDYHSLQREYTLEFFEGKYAFRGYRVNAEFPIRHLLRTVRPSMIEAGSRPYYGKLFRVCPDVVCNDGNMDIYVYNFQRRLHIAANAISLWNGRHDRINKRFARRRLPIIERYEVQKARISSPETFDYHIDGELKQSRAPDGGAHVLEMEICPQAISFIVPESFYWKFSPFREEPSTAELSDR